VLTLSATDAVNVVADCQTDQTIIKSFAPVVEKDLAHVICPVVMFVVPEQLQFEALRCCAMVPRAGDDRIISRRRGSSHTHFTFFPD
jgi:hypothetical protein